MRWKYLKEFASAAIELGQILLAGGKSAWQIQHICRDFEKLNFIPGSMAIYDSKKMLESGDCQTVIMSGHGQVFEYGDDAVALLTHSKRIGIVQNGKFVIETSISDYTSGAKSAAEITKMIAHFRNRPRRKLAIETKFASAAL